MLEFGIEQLPRVWCRPVPHISVAITCSELVLTSSFVCDAVPCFTVSQLHLFVLRLK